MIDDEDEYSDEEDEAGETAMGLAHWIQDHYTGDPRFDSVGLMEPGPLDDEDFRVRLDVTPGSHFFVSLLPEEGVVRVGLATEDEEISDTIEQETLETGGSMTEFVEEAIGAGEELEFEVQHFHDDVFYFCSDIPYETDLQLGSQLLRDTIVYYLDGYIDALYDFLEEEEED